MEGKGGDVGPALDGVALRLDREALWQSMVDPSAVIAPGFGIITVTRKDGSAETGAILESNDKGVKLKLPDGKIKTVPATEIASRTKPLSGMPPMTALLKQHEVRDILEYIVTLKKPAKKGGH